MSNDFNVVDVTTDGGGEASSTGNTLAYQLPSNPTNVVAKVKTITVDNNSNDTGRFLADGDSATTGTAMGAVADYAKQIGHNESIILKDGVHFNNLYVLTGFMVQFKTSEGGTPDVKVTVEVDVLSESSLF